MRNPGRAFDRQVDHICIPNLVQRNFDVARPNKVWVTDITYIRTWEGWLYLAIVMDLFSRKIVGWSTSDHHRRRTATWTAPSTNSRADESRATQLIDPFTRKSAPLVPNKLRRHVETVTLYRPVGPE
jgi:transposase InsO family protein